MDDTYLVEIPPGNTVSSLILGVLYQSIHEDLNDDKFPLSQDLSGRWLYSLLKVRRNVSSRLATSMLGGDRLRPASLGHLLALPVAYPKLESKEMVVALGYYDPRKFGDYQVPVLDTYGGRRRLVLCRWEGDLTFKDFCFLGVRRLDSN